MTLLSDKAQGFLKVAETGSISKAAKLLRLTQPSLTRRIQLLEEELELKLIQRLPKGVQLTTEGQHLLSTLRQMALIEDERIDGALSAGELAGRLSMAGLSSQMNSVFMPLLGPFLRKYPSVQMEFSTREASDLPEILLRLAADFVVMDQKIERQGIVSKILGYETFVAVRHRLYDSRLDVFLDTDPKDEITEKFFAIQGSAKPKRYQRSFVHDTEGILVGVLNGLGCAVLEQRLIPKNAPLSILPQFKPFKVPVVLHYNDQPIYTKVQGAVLSELEKASKFFEK